MSGARKLQPIRCRAAGPERPAPKAQERMR
jgi:hypothetical protein